MAAFRLVLCLAAVTLAAGCSMAVPLESEAARFDAYDSTVGAQAASPGLAVEGEGAERFQYAPGESMRRAFFTRFGAAETDPSASAEEPAGEGGEEPRDGAAEKPRTPARRLMVYKGKFEVLAPSVQDSLSRFVEKVENLGGYLQQRVDGRVVCRVPASHFRDLVDALPSFGVLVSRSIEALDVTKQYFDLELRLETAESSRARLLELLERSEKMEDTLKIEAEVRRLTEEIEKLKGELRFLSDQIAFSTIEVLFRSSAPEPTPVRGRTRSRFSWINRVGVEHVLLQF